MVEPDPKTVRLRLDVRYDGSGFSGWATQPGRRTVQGALQTALGTLLGLPPPSVTAAGRTDAGVHARGQVCHVDLPEVVAAELDPARLVRRLGSLLPEDVRVRRVARVSHDFDARFAALSRRYAYRICTDAAELDPVRRHDVLVWPRPLDVPAMDQAARRLVGEHDFAAFCRRRPGAGTVRELLELDWTSTGPRLVCRVVADAFCHQMVRSIVGALVVVGEGRRPPEWPASLLESDHRESSVPVLPPKGLTLEEVIYPPDGDFALRVAATRRRRPERTGG